MTFLLGVFVAGVIFGWGVTLGVIAFAWLHHRHVAQMEAMEKKAYSEVRFTEIKRINAENERRLQSRRKNAELPKTPEEEQRSFEESLATFYSPEEVERMLKERRKM